MGRRTVYVYFFLFLLYGGIYHCESARAGTSSVIQAKNTTSQRINSGWNFSEHGSELWYRASVPGNIHMDLFDNNLIPDPFYGTNEQNLQWIGKRNWIYQTYFSVDPELLNREFIILRFHGLDTYADVYLNGTNLLSVDNMFRTWNADVKGLIKPDENELRILFRNVFDENLPQWEAAPFRLMAFPNNDQADTMLALYSRKAQFHYGWDWGPRLVTCGIWRPVDLMGWDAYTIESIHIIPESVSEEIAVIKAKLDILAVTAGSVIVNIGLNGETIVTRSIDLKPYRNMYELTFTLDAPRLWWPNGFGEPYLYDFSLTLQDENGIGDSSTLKVGIRSIEVDRRIDTGGQTFTIRVNGVPVFMKGANYIPQDNFQNRVTADRYESLIRSAAEANMNMLRVWGGGIYEENTFYEMCDRYGILVWQDMMFACAMYPGDDGFLESVYYEVVDNIKRIRNHPSVALYCGNNENEIAWHAWGWKEMYPEEIQLRYEQDLHRLFYVTIPAALQETDPFRYYTPTSPAAGFVDRPYGTGDVHYWGVWHGQEPFESYNEHIGRFMSEYGFQSYPELSAVKQFTEPEDRDLHSEVMLSHQRCMADERRDREYGNRLIQTYMERHFRWPKDFESYLYVSQLLQAEGVKKAIETHRINKPFTMGTLYWQINDCWPAASWSSIDYYGNWKALHYHVRDLFKNLIIVPLLRDNTVQLRIVSDELYDITTALLIRVWDINRGILKEDSLQAKITANSSSLINTYSVQELTGGANPADIVLEFRFADEGLPASPKLMYLNEPRDLNLRKPNIETTVRSFAGQTYVTVTSDVLAKNVFLDAGGSPLVFSKNYFDILPGESVTVGINADDSALFDLRVRTLYDTFAN
jgi:beta-mannosidase